MNRTALNEIQELKGIMLAKIQKAHLKETQTQSKLQSKNDQIRLLESELKKCQDDSKTAIDKLMSELRAKDKQILRISNAYRQGGFRSDFSKPCELLRRQWLLRNF